MPLVETINYVCDYMYQNRLDEAMPTDKRKDVRFCVLLTYCPLIYHLVA